MTEFPARQKDSLRSGTLQLNSDNISFSGPSSDIVIEKDRIGAIEEKKDARLHELLVGSSLIPTGIIAGWIMYSASEWVNSYELGGAAGRFGAKSMITALSSSLVFGGLLLGGLLVVAGIAVLAFGIYNRGTYVEIAASNQKYVFKVEGDENRKIIHEYMRSNSQDESDEGSSLSEEDGTKGQAEG